MKKTISMIMMSVGTATKLFADEQLVEEKLDLVLKELDAANSANWDIPDFIIDFFKFLGEIGLLFRILFYLFIIAFVIFILYKIIFLFIKDSNTVLKNKSDESFSLQDVKNRQEDYLSIARALIKKGDFSQAVIQLHHGSFEYLFYKKLILKGRDYTNREIFRLLKGKEVFKPFKEIALEAELTRFRGVRVDENRYFQLESIFKEAFYVSD
jgi:hypothetical protein